MTTHVDRSHGGATRGAADGMELRPAVVLALASGAGLAMFLWPLLLVPPDEFSRNSDAPFLFVLILPVMIGVVLAELQSGGIDTKALAMLGVLSAMGTALRPMGAGVAGIETVFFLLVLAGRVYGPGFGSCWAAPHCSRRRSSPVGWALGCRSRCWPRAGSAWAPGCCPGHGAGPR